MRIVQLIPDRAHLHGATLAQEHLYGVRSQLPSSNDEATVFLLDLSNATSVTGSYLRATVHWALMCGQAEAQGKNGAFTADPWGIRPLPLFPAVAATSAEIVDDVHDFFASRNLPLLNVVKRTKSSLKVGQLLGSVDRMLASTLFTLVGLGEATAADIAAKSNESITVNAWSNRLADLYMLRLVTRRRSGKFWHYSPLAQEVRSWV
jgi:hypothetical protein